MIFYGMVLYGIFMVLHGPFVATYRFGLLWSFLAVIDANSFGLVVIAECIFVALSAPVYRDSTKILCRVQNIQA